MSKVVAVNRVESIVESAFFHRTVLSLIVLNAVIVGLETYPQVESHYGWLLHLADRTILYLFSLELILRFVAVRQPTVFLKNGWNVFDLVIVAAGYLPASQFFTVARLFRVLRVLRAVSVLPNLQTLVAALLKSLPSLGHIVMLLGLLIYVYAAIGTSLFSEISPKYFRTLHQSVLTLFSVITLEGWVSIMDEVLPYARAAWIYFVTFILFGTFVALNFFVGVIVSNLQSAAVEEKDGLTDIREALIRLEARLAEGQGFERKP